MGGLYMLLYDATIIVYTLIIFIIFFSLPLKYNLISFKKRGVKDVKMPLQISGSMIHQDEQLSDLIEIDRQD